MVSDVVTDPSPIPSQPSLASSMRRMPPLKLTKLTVVLRATLVMSLTIEL